MSENEKKKSSKTWIIVLIIMLLFGFGAFAFLVVVGAVIVAATSPVSPDMNINLQKKVLEGKGDNEILILPIKGVIADEQFLRTSIGSISAIKSKLEQAEKDPKIKGVILKINSPGGTITATEIFTIISSNLKQNLKNQL